MTKEINSPSVLMEMINGYRVSRIILTAHELGIFTMLGNKEKTSAEIAGKSALDTRATDRLMNALVVIGLLKKKSGFFSNTTFASRFLVKDSPDFMGNLSHSVHLWTTWSTLTEAVRAGTSVAVEDPIGKRGKNWLESFIGAMHHRGVNQAIEVADVLDFTGIRRILDIGGGSGAFAFEFVRRCDNATAVIFDLPAVIPITRKYIKKSLMTKRVRTVAGDYLADNFGKGFDMVYISAVIHINSPEENVLLLKKSASALNPGGRVVIMDHIMNEERTEPAVGAVFAINMLVGTLHGDTYTENEIKKWMEDAGLTNIKRTDTSQGTSLMIGIK